MTRNALGILFQQHFLTGLGVEVGTQYGAFALDILKHWKGNLLCIDPYTKDDETYKTACRKLGSQRIIRKYSALAVNDFQDESLDFVYIDACHFYHAVMQDLYWWSKKVRQGGIISGHDYNLPEDNFGVKRAVSEFIFEDKCTNLYLTDETENFKSFYFMKQ